MRKTRREFVKGTVALGLVTPFVGCSSDNLTDEPLGPEDLFQHGVASGDPLPDAVILWTRITPDMDPMEDIKVSYEVSLNSSFDELVTMGSASTNSDRDYTVKVDVDGLEAATTYYYRFIAQGRTSIVGRTRTAPEGMVERLRFGVMSCSNYAFGYFHGYRDAAKRADLDAIIHLGDYIYEYGEGEYGAGYQEYRKLQPPSEIITLEDYRTRYSYYRLDPDLQAIHQQFPFITVWDDHEFANDAYIGGAENHMPDTEGKFSDRKKAAMQAYREWMPIRGLDETGRIYRRLKFGDLMDLTMLDTRMWARSKQTSDPQEQMDPNRELLGMDQLAWLETQLKDDAAKWRIIGQQVVFTQLLVGGTVINSDQWDGYVAARERVYDIFESTQIQNLVMLTGDIHASGAADLVRDPSMYDPETAQGAVGVELVAPGITSPFLTGGDAIIGVALSENPPLRWADGSNRGYFILDVTADRVQADWHLYPKPELKDAKVTFAKAFSVEADAQHLTEESKQTTPPKNSPKLAPKG